MSKQPPTTLSLVWCPECGHNNRFADLRLNQGTHYAGGKRCPGKLERLAYVLDPTTTGAVITTGMVEAAAIAMARDHFGLSFDHLWKQEATREEWRRNARLALDAMAQLAAGDAA